MCELHWTAPSCTGLPLSDHRDQLHPPPYSKGQGARLSPGNFPTSLYHFDADDILARRSLFSRSHLARIWPASACTLAGSGPASGGRRRSSAAHARLSGCRVMALGHRLLRPWFHGFICCLSLLRLVTRASPALRRLPCAPPFALRSAVCLALRRCPGASLVTCIRTVR